MVMMSRQPLAAALLLVHAFALVTLALGQSSDLVEGQGAALYAPTSESDRLFKPFEEIDLCFKNDGCTDPLLPFCVKQGLVKRFGCFESKKVIRTEITSLEVLKFSRNMSLSEHPLLPGLNHQPGNDEVRSLLHQQEQNSSHGLSHMWVPTQYKLVTGSCTGQRVDSLYSTRRRM
jgi:hypothetical protein